MIFVNARFLTQKITGVQRFAIEIALRLKKINPDIKFIAPNNISYPDLAKELDVQIIGKRTGYYWEQIELLAFMKKQNNAVLLNMGNNAPLLYKNNAVVIHDICILKYPTWYSRAFYIAYKIMLPRLVKSSKFLFTVSEFCKNEMAAFFKTGRHIDVIYNAVDNKYLTPSHGQEAGYQLYDNYILAVSSHSPRKNFERIIEAFAKLDTNINLVIVGGTYASFPNMKLKIPESKKDNIFFTGYVSDSELYKLYQNAQAFVYPSLYEGFGIPPIEAMSMDCPVIVSDNTCFKEVCKNAALYVDPYDVDDIAQKIKTLCTNDELRSELIQNGQTVKKDYSWDTSADKLYKIINQGKN